MRKVFRATVAAICGAVLLTSCATGDDAVATGGTFDFVSPGGQTRIFYDPRPTGAPSVSSPARTS